MKEQGGEYTTSASLACSCLVSYNFTDFHTEIETVNSTLAGNYAVSDASKQSDNSVLRVIISQRSIQRYERMKEIQKLYRRNKRLQKKLSKTLQLTKGVIEQCNFIKHSNELAKIQSLKRYPTLTKDKNLHSKVNCLTRDILLEVKKWTPNDSFKTHELLFSTEEYKDYVSHILNKRKETNIELIITQAKRNAHNSSKVNKRKMKLSEQPHIDDHKEKEESTRIWKRMDCYFSLSYISLINDLIHLQEIDLNFPQTLNMFAMNRIAAILKMIQYCKDNDIELKDFQKSRVSQKIRGWHKMAKIAAVTHNSRTESTGKRNYMDKKGMCYPLIDELKYLLAIKEDKLMDEIVMLKSLLFASIDGHKESEKEHQLKEVMLNNKQLLKLILKRANAEQGKMIPEIKCDYIRETHRRDRVLKKNLGKRRNPVREMKSFILEVNEGKLKD